MGRRGPAPRPTAIKLAQGMRPDRVNRREPRPEPLPGPPEPPEHLDPVGRETWERLASKLWRLGLLTPLDLDTFAIYCDLVATVRAAREILLRTSLLVRGRRDRLVTNPAWRVYREAVDRVRAFGLTPSARSYLSDLGDVDPDLAGGSDDVDLDLPTTEGAA